MLLAQQKLATIIYLQEVNSWKETKQRTSIFDRIKLSTTWSSVFQKLRMTMTREENQCPIPTSTSYKALIAYHQCDEGPTVRITHGETFDGKMRFERRVMRWTEEQSELSRDSVVTLMSIGQWLVGPYDPIKV